jgi:hypothetical protein
MPSLFRWLSSNHARNIPFLGWGVRGRDDTAGKNWFVVGWGSTYLFTICNVFIDSLSWISAMNQFCPDCWAVSWSNSRSVIWDSAISGGAEWRYVYYLFFKVDFLALSLLFLLTFLPFFYLRVAAFYIN